MSLKEGDESELVLEEAQQGQQQQGLEYEQVQAGNYNYAGEAAHAGEGSNPNENKWNKNGFGQGKDRRFASGIAVLIGGTISRYYRI